MGARNNHIVPFMAVHPGSILSEELEARGISVKDFADKIGVSYQLLDGFVNDKKPLTEELALGIEKELGISYDFWYGLYADYIYDSAIINRRKSEKKKPQMVEMAY